MTSPTPSPIPQVAAPSLNVPPTQLQAARGICTLSHPAVGAPLQFRTNPNSITWNYEMKTFVTETYGGRVIQILGIKMDNLKVTIDCGQGGWNYAMYVVQWVRDLMVQQRNGLAATFTYTTRNWRLKVFADSLPYHDAVGETVRELELSFRIQEDISGVQTSASLDQAFKAISDGIGFVTSGFNNFDFAGVNIPNNEYGGSSGFQSTLNPVAPTVQTAPPVPGIPGAGNIIGSIASYIGG